MLEICNRKKACASFAALLVTALVPLTLTSQQRPARPAWPKQAGAYIATSSEAIPPFPRELSGFRSEDGKDFWGKPFSVTGTMRVFQGNGWLGIPNFPSTMNGCSSGFFMIRWRSDSPDVPVQSSVRYSAKIAGSGGIKTGGFGYMSGTNCDQPMFNFGEVRNRNGATLVDVHYELKFWQAAP
jgi:hypothetical protein